MLLLRAAGPGPSLAAAAGAAAARDGAAAAAAAAAEEAELAYLVGCISTTLGVPPAAIQLCAATNDKRRLAFR